MQLSERLNVAEVLVDSHMRLGRGAKAAILCAERTVRYGDLHESVNRVGNALVDMGVRREDRVAILLPDRPEWAFAFFGAIKIGAVAVPLNTMFTPEDCQYVLNDSHARIIVTDRSQMDRLAKIRAALPHVEHVIVIDDDVDGCVSMAQIQRTCSASLSAADTSQRDMAFWLYSSGTTAVPKGAIHRHRDMIVAADRYAQQTIGLREEDISFSVAKLFFAYGLGNSLYFPLRCGGTTVLLPDAALPETVFAVCDRYQPTVFYSVPTSYAGLLHAAELTGRTSLGRIRMCISAGEPLPKPIFEKWRERFGVEILDGIGSTEMLHIYISNRPGRCRAGSTGNIVPGYEAKILDEDGQEVPAGAVGTLFVKGDSAAAGYWNRDDDTRRTFRGEWVDTHDKFTVDEDGFYWYAGRSDDMFKVSGHAVWPARVEGILQGHPAVLECAVVGASDPDGLIKPLAHVVLKNGYEPSAELARELQHFVRSRTSPHECPQHVTFVARLPKTATGKIQRFKLRELAAADPYVIRWHPRELTTATATARAGIWLVVSDEEVALSRLARQLAARQQRCVTVLAAPGQQYAETAPGLYRLDADEPDHFDRLLSRVVEQDGTALHAVVWLATTAGPNADDSSGKLAEQLQRHVVGVVHVIQALRRRAEEPLPGGLHLVTRAAVAVEPGDDVRPAHSAIWGLGRAIAVEQPQLHCALTDLESGDADVEQLTDRLLACSAEPQMALRGGRWYVPRVVPQRQGNRFRVPDKDCQLTIPQPGALERLELEPIEVSRPAAGQVQVRVRAAGINFRDLLHALNMYPGPWGSDLAGDVVAVGDGVQHLSVGDRVFGFATGTFAERVNTDASLLARLPDHVGYAAGATIPTAFSTARLAFRLAGLKAGQRVLIHAASGGVGLAAVQLAQAAGAKVFATASQPKHAFLRSLGVEHVFDSRTTEFAGAIIDATGGHGVDAVLNSLTGEGFVEATLRTLSVGGCFVEIGKRNIWSADEMRRKRPDVDYRLLTLDDPPGHQSMSRATLLAGIAAEIERGELAPLHHRVYPLAAALDAFRLMQQSRHIGKIVLSLPPDDRPRADATYLITGGFSSFALQAAHALADRGAGRLVLVAAGDPSEAAEASIRHLRDRGCQILVRRADVSRDEDVQAIIREVTERLPPLRGVIHAGGVSDDYALIEQSWRQMENSLAATVRGAWHLHQATSRVPLDFFVLCSSAASVLAPAGHSSETIAAAFLDGLAHHRQASGLPALSVHWDPPADGSAGGVDGQAGGLTHAGSVSSEAEADRECWTELLRSGDAEGLVLGAGWEQRNCSPGSHYPPLLERAEADGLQVPHAESDVFERLRQAPPARRRELLAAQLQQELARILYLPRPPDPDAGFSELGLDSLRAVEFSRRLQSQLGDHVTLPSTLAFDYPSVTQLARHLAGQLWPRSRPELRRERRRAHSSEPVAVVGLACRFPGAPDSDAFWRLLDQGVDAIGEVPAARWNIDAYYDPDPDKPGKMSTRYGGFLPQVDGFDAELFGIAPREAVRMDPQHRALLEVGWEALEHAGIAGRGLVGSKTGVFIGISSFDYAQLTGGDLDQMDLYAGIGGGLAYAAGRLSYVFGLQGPSQAIDTTCSSSLVSVHQACQSLRSRECDLALAGGVNLILTPATYVFLSRAKALSPDGRCKTFDAAANGFSRAEGCGLVVLKRLPDAQRGGNRILAVIRGSAVNHDGPSGGLTVPHGPAQQRVIRAALRQAGCRSSEVSYLEAHGTGTKLGDPIEAQAAAAALGHGRSPEHPLLIGSVKTNIGHLEAAAGIAGLIKVILAIQHDVIPRQLHFKQPNPHIPWDRLPIQVTSEPEPWPRRRRLAGVSAFGFSGTNAHVVLEGPPASDGVPTPTRPDRTHHLLVLSAKQDDALRELAGRYLGWLEEHPEANLADLCFTAGAGRSHLEQRAALVAQSTDQLRQQLTHLQLGRPTAGLLTGRAASKPRTAWLFTGQGSQYAGMGRELYQTQPVFRGVLDQCAEILAGQLERPLREAILEDGDLLNKTTYAQPALFALEMALARLWQSWGIEPDVVLGYSVGQYAAACVAGTLRLEDGVQLVAKHAELMDCLPPGGAIVAEQVLDEFEAFAARFAFQPAERTLISDLTGQPLADGEVLDAAYWRRHAREPVQFDASIAALAESGIAVLLEIGPRPVLLGMAAFVWPQPEAPALVPSLGAGKSDTRKMLEALAALYVRGVAPDFEAFDRPWPRQKLSLPTYPFQRQRYWVETERRPDATENPPAVSARVDELLYEVQWQAQSRGGAHAGFLNAPAEITRRVQHAIDRPGEEGPHIVDSAWRADLDDLSCRYVLEAFQRLGGPWAAGGRVDVATLAEAWGVDVAHRRRLLNRLLSVLSNAGWIRREGTGWRLPAQWPPTQADKRQCELLRRDTWAETELTLVGRCGARLADALTGKTDALELLFPQQGLGAQDVYRVSSDAAAGNRLIRQVFEQAAASLPSGRRLRVLEIGAGTGGTTASVLPVLPAGRCDYVYTDVSAAFFTGAAQRFAEYPFVSYRTLDAERDPESQQVRAHEFDIVLAANILHATRDIEATVRHARRLLAPGGWLVLLEAVQPRAWLDVTFGLLEGWWRFDDRLRSDYALMDVERWVGVLSSEGLTVESLAPGGSADQALLLAQAPFQLPSSGAQPVRERATWLILAGRDGVGATLAEMLRSRGQRCQLVRREDVDDSSSGFERVLAQLAVSPDSPRHIVHLWNLDVASVPSAEAFRQAERVALITASLMQAVERRAEPARVWFVTRGSQSVLENESTAPQQALLWGMAKVASIEMPERCHGQIDLPLSVEPADLETLVETLLDAGGEDQLAIRRHGLYASRLTALPRSRPAEELMLGDEESYLISGGLGQLGLQAARWLAERGAKHLILNSRTPLPDAEAGSRTADEVLRQRVHEVESLQRSGVAVHVLAADVSDAEALRAAWQRLEVPPLRGVIHAAGVGDLQPLSEWSPDSLRRALAAKVQGAWNLHELTAGQDLRFFVNFSSASSVWGALGQAAYAAANAFLDSLAHYRRAAGLPALSVNWARWSIGATTREHHQSMEAMGLRAFRPAEALAALAHLLARGAAQAVVADVDWSRFKAIYESRGQRRLFADIAVPAAGPASKAGAVSRDGLPDRLRGAGPSGQTTAMVGHLQQLVSEVLQSRTTPQADIGFFDLGVDSLMAVELRNRLQSELGVEPPLPASLVFDHPTIRALADHLVERVNPSVVLSRKPAPSSLAAALRGDLQEPLAIIGLGCRFPGAASVEEYWTLLREGTDAVRSVPSNRREMRSEPGDMYRIDYGGFLDEIDLFDPLFFGISPREAADIDPQQRLLLEVSWSAFEHAGLPVEQLAGAAVGVFVGISQMEYGQLLYEQERDLGIHAVTGIPLSAAAGRLSYTFGFEGPALALDTACSSSLTAMHQACNSLRMKECDIALAAGVNAIITPRATRELAKAGMLSPDGRCRTFDEDANGFGRGEGCGVVLLKRLSDAQRDGNSILAVIRGSACNQDGATSGFTVPSGPSQERVIAAAIRQAGVKPEMVDYLEAHGTGTRLGDPIEVLAAAAVLGAGRTRQQPLLIGSVKTNLGHLESAAGIAGLIKVVLAMQHRLIPKHLHFKNPSTHIPWERLPVKVVDEATPWPERAHPPLAGVSSLGASGTNVHVVLEGPSPSPRQDVPRVRDRSHHVLTLSAKTPQALRELAARYRQWLDVHPGAQLPDVCHTAAAGRSHFPHRAALVAASLDELRCLLESLEGDRPAAGMFIGHAGGLPKMAWLFSDQNALSMTMGKELYETQPVFRDVIDQSAEFLSPMWDVSLLQVLFEDGTLRGDTTFAQAAVFAWEMALARLYQSWGLHADVLLGYDVGQYAAACVAEMLTLEEGLQLLAERGRSLGSHAFRPATRTLVSNLDGRPIFPGQTLSADDRRRHAREPVQFARCVQTLKDLGCELLLEVGPQTTLSEMALSCWPDDKPPTRIDVSLGSQNAGYELCLAIAQLYASGVSVQWAAWDGPWPRQKPSLPTYPFQRQRYWLPTLPERTTSPPSPPSVASEYYDALTTSVLAPDLLFGPGKVDDAFLTFVPFPEVVPGFSWIRTFAFPEDEHNASRRALVFREQQHMRRMLFRHVDFSSCRTALDFGCGYGSDLVRLGKQHPHLALDGFTISARQCEIVAQKIADEQLQPRVRVFHRDSSADEFPGQYDLIFGMEVACHIKNKDGLFQNIANHLSEAGTVVLADFISNAQFAIEHPSTSSYLITQEQWAQLLSRCGLEVVECIDAGREVANSLYEPEREDTLRELSRRASDANIFRGIESYVQLGEMLRKGLMRYVLLTARRRPASAVSGLLGLNRAALSDSVAYSDVAPHRWLYELQWQPEAAPRAAGLPDMPAAQPAQRSAAGAWLVLADRGGVGRALAAALEHRGGRCCLVEIGSAWEQVDERCWRIPPGDLTAYARLVRQVVDGTRTPLAGVVHLWSVDDRPPAELTLEDLASAQESGTKSVLLLLQALLQHAEAGQPRVWLVTRGAVATGPVEPPVSLAAACAWGLGRVLSLEHPHLWGGLIDLAPGAEADEQASQVLGELLGRSDEDQAAYRHGQRYVPRLVRAMVRPARPFDAAADATYLITGGLGALGSHVAQWLVERGARNLVLCSRRGGGDLEARWQADHPDAAGCNVRLLRADVAREEDVRQLLQTIHAELPPLRGVVHAAGTISHAPLARMTVSGLDEVLRPKVQGAWNLHALTEHMPLDLFVCFSSIAAVWGSAGQAHYAAANAFLDALCHYRRHLGLPALSVNWGPMADGGMLDTQSQTWLQERGVKAMTREEALDVLEQLLGHGASQPVAAKVDWPTFKAIYESARRRPLLDGLGRQDETDAARNLPGSSAFVRQLRDLPARERPNLLQTYVLQQIARTLGCSPEQIGLRQGLFDVGMDSLTAVELRHRFTTDLGVVFPSTLLFDHPTVESLVGHLIEALLPPESTVDETETRVRLQPPFDRPGTEHVEPQKPHADRLDRIDSEAELDVLLSEKVSQILGAKHGRAT